MTVPTLSRDAIREYDRRAIEEFGIPGVVLMENAGRGVAELLLSLGCKGPVAICCGKGNNGGDGFVIARHLDRAGIPVVLHCWQPLDDWTGDAGINAKVAQNSNLECRVHTCSDWEEDFSNALEKSDWIVDALLGTGASGSPRSPLSQAIQIMNQANGRKLAVDIPSGLDCDTGEVGSPTFQADYTCTFVAAKPGMLHPKAKPFVGQLTTKSIGAPQKLFDEFAASS